MSARGGWFGVEGARVLNDDRWAGLTNEALGAWLRLVAWQDLMDEAVPIATAERLGIGSELQSALLEAGTVMLGEDGLEPALMHSTHLNPSDLPERVAARVQKHRESLHPLRNAGNDHATPRHATPDSDSPLECARCGREGEKGNVLVDRGKGPVHRFGCPTDDPEAEAEAEQRDRELVERQEAERRQAEIDRRARLRDEPPTPLADLLPGLRERLQGGAA